MALLIAMTIVAYFSTTGKPAQQDHSNVLRRRLLPEAAKDHNVSVKQNLSLLNQNRDQKRDKHGVAPSPSVGELHKAAEKNDVLRMRWWAESGVNIDQPGPRGYSALHTAAAATHAIAIRPKRLRAELELLRASGGFLDWWWHCGKSLCTGGEEHNEKEDDALEGVVHLAVVPARQE